ncbi:MAG: D-alanyl-D-alanine carboxypeptidase, partial [Actinomycetota bacterium]|nr:D-alanyl-D-alanine carboxypeptidase [Actinomycetota bacterium]
GVTADGVAVRDGSGLSRESRIRPEALVLLLRRAASAEHPELRPAVTGLPVAGLTGTLAERYTAAQSRMAAGTVRAKTGTLSGVNTLAGLVQDADGRLLAFAFAAEGTASQDAARQALDRVAATLAACGCR